MSQDEKLKAITKHFGIETELTKLSEEIGELLNECYSNYYTGKNKDNIEDELADVYVLLNQIKLYFNVDTLRVGQIVDQKIDRTVTRINSGWYEKHR